MVLLPDPPLIQRGPQDFHHPTDLQLNMPSVSRRVSVSVSFTCHLLIYPVVKHINSSFNSQICWLTIFLLQHLLNIRLNLPCCFTIVGNHLTSFCSQDYKVLLTHFNSTCQDTMYISDASIHSLVRIILVAAIELDLAMVFQKFTWGSFVSCVLWFSYSMLSKLLSWHCWYCCSRVKVYNNMSVSIWSYCIHLYIVRLTPDWSKREQIFSSTFAASIALSPWSIVKLIVFISGPPFVQSFHLGGCSTTFIFFLFFHFFTIFSHLFFRNCFKFLALREQRLGELFHPHQFLFTLIMFQSALGTKLAFPMQIKSAMFVLQLFDRTLHMWERAILSTTALAFPCQRSACHSWLSFHLLLHIPLDFLFHGPLWLFLLEDIYSAFLHHIHFVFFGLLPERFKFSFCERPENPFLLDVLRCARTSKKSEWWCWCWSNYLSLHVRWYHILRIVRYVLFHRPGFVAVLLEPLYLQLLTLQRPLLDTRLAMQCSSSTVLLLSPSITMRNTRFPGLPVTLVVPVLVVERLLAKHCNWFFLRFDVLLRYIAFHTFKLFHDLFEHAFIPCCLFLVLSSLDKLGKLGLLHW